MLVVKLTSFLTVKSSFSKIFIWKSRPRKSSVWLHLTGQGSQPWFELFLGILLDQG